MMKNQKNVSEKIWKMDEIKMDEMDEDEDEYGWGWRWTWMWMRWCNGWWWCNGWKTDIQSITEQNNNDDQNDKI